MRCVQCVDGPQGAGYTNGDATAAQALQYPIGIGSFRLDNKSNMHSIPFSTRHIVSIWQMLQPSIVVLMNRRDCHK